MGSAKNKNSAERKARIEEMRRAERARERRNRILTIAASTVVVAGLVVGGVVLVQSQSDKKDEAKPDKKTSGKFVAGADGVKTWKGTLASTHVETSVKYLMEPPVGGNHHRAWMNCNGDVYTKELARENAVHSLEHGAVWVTYTSKAAKADVEALAAKVKQTPYTLMSPDEQQKDPIMLSAWGHQRTVTSASDPNVGKFFETYVQGKQTPEPGAACTNGLSE
ncbi:DUF3105 domain-containing protein [Streptomyces sp. uw30]|uniref:DUF3105 domain-containing protein n=1 Tax=Streptomyces sp. uw30 TaxID=1828179 RepID=UPI0011CD6D98|nr:DUF3105 domain-containing protein [Streptomyces sp. uw30]TXS45139.1 DUF3105 domain-containing protein [Streptomyces sp. uw30]